MTRDNTTASGDRPARRSGAGLSTRSLNHRASSPRVRLLSLVLCCAVLLPSSLFASGPKSASPGVRKTPATTPARQTQTSPAGLPDLNEARRRPARDPHAVPPVPSTPSRCPPRDRRCNDYASASPPPPPHP